MGLVAGGAVRGRCQPFGFHTFGGEKNGDLRCRSSGWPSFHHSGVAGDSFYEDSGRSSRCPAMPGTGFGTATVGLEQLSSLRGRRVRSGAGEGSEKSGAEGAQDWVIRSVNSGSVVPSFATQAKLGQPQLIWRRQCWASPPSVIMVPDRNQRWASPHHFARW